MVNEIAKNPFSGSSTTPRDVKLKTIPQDSKRSFSETVKIQKPSLPTSGTETLLRVMTLYTQRKKQDHFESNSTALKQLVNFVPKLSSDELS